MAEMPTWQLLRITNNSKRTKKARNGKSRKMLEGLVLIIGFFRGDRAVCNM